MSCTDVYRPAKDFAFESTFEEPMDEFYEDDNGDHVWCSIYLDEIVSSPFFSYRLYFQIYLSFTR